MCIRLKAFIGDKTLIFCSVAVFVKIFFLKVCFLLGNYHFEVNPLISQSYSPHLFDDKQFTFLFKSPTN